MEKFAGPWAQSVRSSTLLPFSNFPFPIALLPFTLCTLHCTLYMYTLNIGGWGGESNREIDFGFGSCVRARALDVESERASNFRWPASLFPFVTLASPFSLWESSESSSIQMKPSEAK